MSLATILARVQALVGGVAGIGASRVHLGTRRLSDELLQFAGQDGTDVPRMHLWLVGRGPVVEEHLSTGSNTVTYQALIEGYYQVRDPSEAADAVAVGTSMTSEVTFSALSELVRDALRSDGALHGGGAAINCGPPQCPVWDVRQLGSEDCHHCEIQIQIEEEIIISYT